MALDGVASFLMNTLAPDGETERFIFRKFDGEALARATETNGVIKKTDVMSVVLKVNPQELTVTKVKIINKVATNAPGRFVVFDWGNDLTMFGISGVTGQLLPTAVTSGYDPMKGVVDDFVSKLDPLGASLGFGDNAVSKAASVGQKILLGGLGYFEMLELSPKYRAFRRLEEIYDHMDADADVLTMEMGQFVYRGYFTEFRFTVSKDSPWNWSYDISFVSLDNLTEKEKRGEEKISRDIKIMAVG